MQQRISSHHITAFIAIIAILTTVLTAHAGPDYSWVKVGENVESNRIYVKIASESAPLDVSVYDGLVLSGAPALDAVADAFGVYELEKAYFIAEWTRDNPKADDLDRYYIAHFPEAFNPLDVVAAYERCTEVEFAEPIPIEKALYRPNDPGFRNQWHLELCDFEEAWDVSRGSEEIVIGIVDSGIDMDADEQGIGTPHEDLEANLWENFGEDANGDGVLNFDDMNGRDDDDNGKEDDFWGWDFTGRDNLPNDEWGPENGHGTHVAGIASAVTDNETGVSGAAFSCRLMIAACYNPQSPDNMFNTDQGIHYCAQNGADVMNLSFGHDGGPQRGQREVIEFALNEGVAIFAGAGNDNVEDRVNRRTHFYPCAYEGVFGIAASNERDDKANFSNYGDYIDLVAPGVAINSTFPHNAYNALQGTSMSSPFAAGLGALMLSVVPNMTNDLLLEKLQEFSTDISEENERYPGIQHRINAGRALGSFTPLLGLDEWEMVESEGDGDERAEPGESHVLRFVVSNQEGHSKAEGGTYRLEIADEDISLNRPEGELPELEAGESYEVPLDEAPVITVLEGSEPHYSTFTLVLEADDGPQILETIDLTIGQPYYLLVDDDNGDAFDTFYEQDMAVRPLVHDTWNVTESGLPELEWLSEFRSLIWETGNDEEPLSDEEMTLLRQYLTNGRGLILCGQYIGDAHGESGFFPEVIHANHEDDLVQGPILSGVEGNPISDGMSLFLIGGGAAGNNISPSSVQPVDGAQALFTYDRSGKTGGTYYTNGSYNLVYLGFSLEAASGLRETTLRHEFLETALDYFGGVSVDEQPSGQLPQEFTLSAPYPNPFNSTTSIQVALPHRSEISLDVVDVGGRVITTMHSGLETAGKHRFSWNSEGQAAGVYFFRLKWDGGNAAQKVIYVR